MVNGLRTFLEEAPNLVISENLLTIACINGEVESIGLLLSLCANPNEFDPDRAQPLHNVAMSMVRPACAKSVASLIKAGADPASVHRGQTPLQRARAAKNDAVEAALHHQGVTR